MKAENNILVVVEENGFHVTDTNGAINTFIPKHAAKEVGVTNDYYNGVLTGSALTVL